jgi:hypothetical protein
MEPKPELEAAYAHIKRESNRQEPCLKLVQPMKPQPWLLSGPNNLGCIAIMLTLLVTDHQ